MKQRLLSLFAFAAMTVGAWAQSWTAPVEPVAPALEAATELTSGSTYYLRHVGTGQFVIGANSWATQISLSTNGLPYMRLVLEDATETFADSYRLKLDGTFYFSGGNGRNNYAVSNTYLFRDAGDGGGGFIDWNNNGCTYFLFPKVDGTDTHFYWQAADETMFGDALSQYTQGTAAGAAVFFKATIEDEGIEWEFIPSESVNEDFETQAAIYTEAMKLYNAKLNLYNLLEDAKKYGVDTSAAAAVYNTEGATVDELNAAYNTLKPAVDKAGLEYAIKNSSEEEPFDITNYVLENPSFDNGQTGWTITEGMGQNLQVQSASYTNGDVKIQGFIEAWIPQPSTLKDGVICQKVTGLPEGRYRIEADVMSVQQSGQISLSEQMGVYLYYNNGTFVFHSESLSTGDGVPDHFAFDFDYDGAEVMEIGLMTQNTNCNWMGMDNLKLFAIGEVQTPPIYNALQSAVLAAADTYVEYHANATVSETFQDILSEATEMATTNPDKDRAAEYLKAYDDLNAAIEALKTSIADYNRLDSLVKVAAAAATKYEEVDDKAVSDFLEKLEVNAETWEEAYEQGSMTGDEIANAVAQYNSDLATALAGWRGNIRAKMAEIAEAGQGSVDISPLFDNLEFDGAFSGSNIPGWTYKKTAGDGQAKTNRGLAEIWNASADLHQTVKDLPRGTYTIKTTSLYRTETSQSMASQISTGGEPDLTNAKIYINGNSIAPNSIFEGSAPDFPWASDETREQYNMWSGDAGDDSYVEIDDLNADSVYVPNSLLGAQVAFAAEAYSPQMVSTAIVNTGDSLTIGISIENHLVNCWFVVAPFQIIYDASGINDALKEQIQTLITEAAAINDAGVIESQTKIENAINKGTDALESDVEATLIEAIDALESAIEYASKSEGLASEINQIVLDYLDLLGNLPVENNYTDLDYFDMIVSIDNNSYESNEWIEETIQAIKDGWVPYVMSKEGIELATIDEPVDMSELLVNATFDNNDYTGWTIVNPETGENINGGTARDGVAEFWNSSVFDIYQEIPALAEGYWRLEVDACMRAGGSDNEIAVLNAMAAGTDTIPMNEEYLYVHGKNLVMETKIMQWSNLEGGAITVNEDNTDLIGLLSGQTTYTVAYEIEEGVQSFVAPNAQGSWATFAAQGRYHNIVDFAWTPANGAVKIGLTSRKTMANIWCPFDNFRISYLGKEEAPVAINAVNATTKVGATKVYSIDGAQRNGLRRGINIVKMSDGSVRKVLVK